MKFVNITNTRSADSVKQDDIVLTKRSRIEPANNNDILFEYGEATLEEAGHRFTSILRIKSVAENQVISEKGRLTLRGESIREAARSDFERWFRCQDAGAVCSYRQQRHNTFNAVGRDDWTSGERQVLYH